MHARRQAVLLIFRAFERDGVDAPFQHEKADRQNIDRVFTHAAFRIPAC